MKTANYRASKRLAKMYEDMHGILAKQNERAIRKREHLGRLEVVCDMIRAKEMKDRGIQLKEPIIYHLNGERSTHIKWTGYHIPAAPSRPVRARWYSLVAIAQPNYSTNALEVEYSLTMGHKIFNGTIAVPGRKKK